MFHETQCCRSGWLNIVKKSMLPKLKCRFNKINIEISARFNKINIEISARCFL